VTRRYLQTALSALLLSLALTGCAATEKCGIQPCPSDAEITARVQSALDGRADLGAPGAIGVQTVNHVVYLSRAVSVNSARRAAANVARRASGVTQIENMIAVSP
jgi:osmotically-inducible protein OsmY